MNVDDYLYFRNRVKQHDSEMFKRTGTKKPPTDSTDFAIRVSYVILNSGMRWTVAQDIWRRLEPSLIETGDVGDTFGHPGKTRSINRVMQDRDQYFGDFCGVWSTGDKDQILTFCESLPHIGPITKFHLAKNLGLDCAKPDVWLERVARSSNEDVQEMCQRLTVSTGDSLSLVDYVIWKACQQGWWPREGLECVEQR